MLPNVGMEAILQNHGVVSGGLGGDGIKVVKSPTEPTTGLRDGLIWLNTTTNESRIYIDGQFIYFGNGLGIFPYFGTVVVPSDTNRVTIPIPEFFPGSDVLLVTQNTAQIFQSIHYDLDRKNKQIVKKSGNWVKDTHLFFMVLAPSPAALGGMTIAVYEYPKPNVSAGTTQIAFDIPKYNPITDYLSVYQRKLPLFKGVDWSLGNDNQSIILTSALVEADDFHFIVHKKVRVAGDMEDEVATKVDLQRHLIDQTPHYISDGINSYKYGFRIKPDTREVIFGWNNN